VTFSATKLMKKFLFLPLQTEFRSNKCKELQPIYRNVSDVQMGQILIARHFPSLQRTRLPFASSTAAYSQMLDVMTRQFPARMRLLQDLESYGNTTKT
jgi:hypothetical protein